MRLNLPVNQNEYPFPSGKTLVSTTDLKGRILYCNSTFIEVSGYTKDELLGQAHNIVRHPDMPEEAYRDLWDTIAAGKPWSAPVKNRRKNGDYYWVVANAIPLMEGDRPVGYMSVRTEATREQIQAAEALYQRMREEKAAGRLVHVLKEGRLLKNTWRGRWAERLRLGMGTKVTLWVGLVWLCTAVWPVWNQSYWNGLSNVLALGTSGLVALLTVWRLRSLAVAPLTEFVAITNRMAAGDLTQKIVVNRSDTLGQLQKALSQLNVNLMSIVRDARLESEAMRHATQEIALGNQDLSQRTESQASNLEQTAASMEEITGTVRQSAETAQTARSLSDETFHMAEQGSQVVNDVSVTMNGIQASSRRISDITQVIDSIAFQTNILALNAAVEAARAGEQGRGFAVVASEVRTLAQRTQSAAKEIRLLIDDSVQKISAGHERTEAARATMQDTLHKVSQVNTLIGEISNAVNEQLTGISQVNSAINHLDQLTQQNASLVEQITASAMSLEEQAGSVAESVAVFRIDNGPRAMSEAVHLRRIAKKLPIQ